jgi:ABC-2 type transport system ATP-binding protein
MISIRNLTRKYGDDVAVDALSLEIARGEVVGLLGHNGAGKTTVMKILTGFLEATSGSVLVAGIDVAEDRTAVQERIGYLPENAPLYPEMRVQEYLRTIGELRGLPADAIDAAIVDAAEATGLIDHLVAPIANLSKGYRQRVGIAQAILHKPDVLVLDEPTNGLDPMQIQLIRDLIRRLAQDTTIILSTHILQEIEAVCDRVVILIQGTLVTDARLADLLERKRIVMEVESATLGDLDAAQAKLEALAGVQSVTREASQTAGDTTRFVCKRTSDVNPVPAILEIGAGAGWRIHSIAPDHHTLEDVFRDLHAAHVARQSQGADPTEPVQ